MEKLSILSSLIKSADLFSSLELLRFNKRNKISTIEGGIASLLVFAFLAYSFLSVVSQTFEKTKISYIQTVTNNKDGTFYQLRTGQQGNFMFAIRMTSTNMNLFNLSHTQRYLDFVLFQLDLQSGQVKNIIPHGLEECTQEHWAAFPEIAIDFNKLKMSNWLCPRMDQVFPLSGIYLSDNSQSLILQVRPCNNASNYGPSVCYPQQQIDKFFTSNGNLFINFLFTNPILNLQNVEYINYELNKLSTFPINNQFGNMVDLGLSDFVIKTDSSIWPISAYEQVKGLMMDGTIVSRTSLIGQANGYLSIYIRKSPTSRSYFREVQKISTIVSQIGGLFGIFYGCLAFMNLFTEQFYLKKMIKKVFDLRVDTKVGNFCETFNVFRYLQLSAIKFIEWTSIKDVGKWVKELQEYQKQLNIQLDVSVLIKRIAKLEKLMINIVPHEDIVVCLNNKQSLRSIRENLGQEVKYSKQPQNPLDFNQQTVFTQSQFIKNSQLHNRHQNIEIQQINEHDKDQKQREKQVICKNSNNLLIIRNRSKLNIRTSLMGVQKDEKNLPNLQKKYNSKGQIEEVVEVPCTIDT